MNPAYDVAQSGAGQVDDLVLIVGDIVERGFDALLVGLYLEVHLRVYHGVQIVVSDDGLRLGLNERLPDIHLIHPLRKGDDLVKAWIGIAVVFAETLHEAALSRPDHPSPQCHEHDDENDHDADNDAHDQGGHEIPAFRWVW